MGRMKQSVKNISQIFVVFFELTPGLFPLIFLLMLLKAIQPFINIVFFQIIIDGFQRSENSKQLMMYIFWAIFLNVIILSCISILTKKNTELSAKLELNFNKELNLHQMNLTLEDIESNQIKKLQRNIEQTKMRNGGIETILTKYRIILKNVFSLFLAVLLFTDIFHVYEKKTSISFWTGKWPLYSVMLCMVISILVSFKIQIKQNEKIADLNEKVNEANGGAFAYMQLISDYHFGKDIRIYNLKDFLCKEFNKLWKSSIGYKLTKRLGREKAIIPVMTCVLNGILDFCIFYIVAMKAIYGVITAGTIVSYIGSIQIFAQSVMSLVNSIGELIGYGELVKPYLEIISIPEEHIKGNEKELPPPPFLISFEDVSFQYPNSDVWVLQDVNFTIINGQKIALVGMNGSGKSTIVKLLCRFYEPQKGKIKINGIDIREFTLSQYRKWIGIIFQDYSLLSLKFCENIACSDIYSENKIKKIIADIGLLEWVKKQKDGIDTYLFHDYAKDGVEISGGEAQKTAIARAVYKNAILVIMDEPTASLDPRSEAKIYEDFDTIVVNKTAIYISHRLSSCQFCHNILVFDNGRLIQKGTHEKLVNQVGKYQELWQAQAQFYT